MAHLCTFAVFMFYALKSDFHLHLPSLMPSLHQRCRSGMACLPSSHQQIQGEGNEGG